MTRFSYSECTALITGASAGLGAEFARQLAPHASCVILVARREQMLHSVHDELLKINSRLRVIVCAADVATESGRRAIVAAIAEYDLPVNVLINNAGLGDYGRFESAEIARIRSQIDVNISALVELTHALIPVLNQHKPAGILNVSSLAGTLPLPDMAIYAATKAFVTSFSESLRIELLDSGIRVAAVCPGPTPTTFSHNAHRKSGSDADRSGERILTQPPQKVVAQGLNALVNGTSTVYPGWGVRLSASIFRIIPRWLLRPLLLRRFRAARRV